MDEMIEILLRKLEHHYVLVQDPKLKLELELLYNGEYLGLSKDQDFSFVLERQLEGFNKFKAQFIISQNTPESIGIILSISLFSFQLYFSHFSEFF